MSKLVRRHSLALDDGVKVQRKSKVQIPKFSTKERNFFIELFLAFILHLDFDIWYLYLTDSWVLASG